MSDDPRALSAEEWEQFLRNKQPADHFMVARMIVSLKLLHQVERACRLLCKYQPGIYDYVEKSLGALDASREG